MRDSAMIGSPESFGAVRNPPLVDDAGWVGDSSLRLTWKGSDHTPGVVRATGSGEGHGESPSGKFTVASACSNSASTQRAVLLALRCFDFSRGPGGRAKVRWSANRLLEVGAERVGRRRGGGSLGVLRLRSSMKPTNFAQDDGGSSID